MGNLIRVRNRLLVTGLLGFALMYLGACTDVYLDPYTPPLPPVDLIITASGISSEGAIADVYLSETGQVQTAVVSDGRFTVSFLSVLEANQTYLIDMQVFVDDNVDLCCDITEDTVFGYMEELSTGDSAVVMNIDLGLSVFYPSDCTFFGRCSP